MSELNSVGFFTPISFDQLPKTWSETFLESADSYFTLGSSRACVLDGCEVGDCKAAIIDEVEAPSMFSTALKVVSYFTVVIPLIVLVAKALLRLTQNFHLLEVNEKKYSFAAKKTEIEGEKELTQGITLSNRAKLLFQKIDEDPASIFAPDKLDKLTLIEINRNIQFIFPNVPNYILDGNTSTDSVEEALKVRMICQENKLDLLVVPHLQTYEVTKKDDDKEKTENYCLIERLSMPYDLNIQEELYGQLTGLDETLKQLVTYIIKSGIPRFSWMTAPILDCDPSFSGNRRIALLSRETSPGFNFNAHTALLDLIGCLSNKKQMELVIEEAEKQGITIGDDADQKIEKRLKEIEDLRTFYKDKEIDINPRKPIKVDDLASLGLDLTETAKPSYDPSVGERIEKMAPKIHKKWLEMTERSYTMEEVIKDVIVTINDAMQKRPESTTTKGKRNVTIPCEKERTQSTTKLDIYRQLGVSLNYSSTESWLERIVIALKDKGHLYSMQSTYSSIKIQA